MALPKCLVTFTGPVIIGTEAYLSYNATVITTDGRAIGGPLNVVYTGTENLNQLKTAISDACIALAAGNGVTIAANDIIISTVEKG